MGAVGVIVAGALWHFAYSFSGDSPLVAAIAPANESVWEHLKLVLVPVLALAVLETKWVADHARLWWAKCVEVTTACTFIVAFFYTYTGALGVPSILVVDVVNGQAQVPAFGQVKVPTLCGLFTWSGAHLRGGFGPRACGRTGRR